MMLHDSAGSALRPFFSPLAGRAEERVQLQGCINSLDVGRGNLLIISGEPGIGKTRLLAELTTIAEERHIFVLTLDCDLQPRKPSEPWLRMFSSYEQREEATQLPRLPDEIVKQQVITDLQALRRFFAGLAQKEPFVLAINALHEADQDSLMLLRDLVDCLVELPILVAITCRSLSQQSTEQETFVAVCDRLRKRYSDHALRDKRQGIIEITLSSLRNPDIVQMIRNLYPMPMRDARRLASLLVESTGGVPLLIEKVLKYFEQEGLLAHDGRAWHLASSTVHPPLPPELMQRTVIAFGGLDEADQQALIVAAVIGLDVPIELWQRACGLDDTAMQSIIRRAKKAGVLVDLADGWHVRFDHALTRQTIYNLEASARASWHRKIGELLENRPILDQHAVYTIAHHFREGRHAHAREALIRAGDRAQASNEWLAALEYFGAALELSSGTGEVDAERGWLLVRLSRLSRYADTDRGVSYLLEARQVAASLDPLDTALSACIEHSFGLLYVFAGRLGRGIQHLERGVAALDALSDEATRQIGTQAQHIGAAQARTNRHGSLLFWLVEIGQYQRAQQLWQRIEAEYGAQARGPQFHNIDFGRAKMLTIAGDVAVARQYLRQARAGWGATGHHLYVGLVMLFELHWLVLPHFTDDVDGRQRLAAAAEDAWVGARGLSNFDARVAWLPLYWLEGRWAEARQIIESGNDPIARPFTFFTAVQLAYHQGRDEELRAFGKELLPNDWDTEVGTTDFLNGLALMRVMAQARVDSADFPAAEAWLDTHKRWRTQQTLDDGVVLLVGEAEEDIIRASLRMAQGHLDNAHAIATVALAKTRAPNAPLARIGALRLLGEIATRRRNWPEATALLDEAWAGALTCKAVYERALILIAQAKLLLAQQPQAQSKIAAEYVAAARAIGEQLGATTIGNLINSIGRISGAPAKQSERNSAEPSSRERELLKLASEGYSAPRIAGVLNISERTVSNHFQAIYIKFGVRTRAQAVAHAMQSGYIPGKKTDS